jgi:hypothetical protein
MKQMSRWGRWLILGLAAVAVALAGLAANRWSGEWTRRELRARFARQIRSLPEDQAAAKLRELQQLGTAEPALVIPHMADEREVVAAAARATLSTLVDQCRFLPAAEASSQVAALARELAMVAPQLPIQRRPWAHNVATRLVLWPLDPQATDVGQVLADCEAVLALPPAADAEIRVATAPPADVRGLADVPPLAPISQHLPAPLPGAESSPAEPAMPRIYGPVEPERLIDASRERPAEPKQFLPPRAMKIEG